MKRQTNFFNPFLFWITGYPGAGKTTIAYALKKYLKERDISSVLIDGDEFRAIFSKDLGYSPEDRLENAWRIAKLSYFLNSQGVNVITATVSMYKEVRRWLRKKCLGYREIYIKASKDTLIKRNKKSLYSNALKGAVSHIPGIDLLVDEPQNPHLIINNDSVDIPLVQHIKKISRLIEVHS